VPKRIAKWNPARDVWETDQGCLCGHLDAWSETFPPSAMWDESGLYELPTLAPPTGDSATSAHGNGNGHGKSLAIEAQRLLPTPMRFDSNGVSEAQADRHSPPLGIVVRGQEWGVYADAITRWETLTRPAPPPTQPSKKGTPQLSPRFSEWMQGLPDGWVTDVPGVTRNEALKAIGNGVCPQQAAAALRFLLAGAAIPALPRPSALFDTPDTRPDAPNTGSNRKAQVAGLGNQVQSLLPTPRATRGGSNTETVSLLPTPNAADASGGRYNSDGHQDTLPGVARLLPTPRASDGEKGGPNQRGSSGDLMLPSAVMGLPPDADAETQRLLPTPTAQAAKHSADDRGPGTLDDGNLWSVVTRLSPDGGAA
jgi:hypothetical protein